VNDAVTPRLSEHARVRCGEMGVGTKRVKAIVRTADVRRPSRGLVMATRKDEPDIAVLYEDSDPPVVVSVLWRTADDYVRKGSGFTTVQA
jgi:hypothetical protein